MIDVGTILHLGGREGIVCFIADYNGKYYINVNFEENGKDEYKVYEVIVDEKNSEYVFRIEKDEEIINELAARWVAEELVEDNE